MFGSMNIATYGRTNKPVGKSYTRTFTVPLVLQRCEANFDLGFQMRPGRVLESVEDVMTLFVDQGPDAVVEVIQSKTRLQLGGVDFSNYETQLTLGYEYDISNKEKRNINITAENWPAAIALLENHSVHKPNMTASFWKKPSNPRMQVSGISPSAGADSTGSTQAGDSSVFAQGMTMVKSADDSVFDKPHGAVRGLDQTPPTYACVSKMNNAGGKVRTQQNTAPSGSKEKKHKCVVQ